MHLIEWNYNVSFKIQIVAFVIEFGFAEGHESLDYDTNKMDASRNTRLWVAVRGARI